MSTPEREGQRLFDVSGIDWNDNAEIDRVAQMIWTIADEEKNRDEQ